MEHLGPRIYHAGRVDRKPLAKGRRGEAGPRGVEGTPRSCILSTGHARVPYLIVAPIMVTPEKVAAENCYREMRAVLRVAAADPDVSASVYSPGLGTAVGGVEPA